MEAGDILYVVLIMVAVDNIAVWIAPQREGEGYLMKLLRDFTRCFVLFLIALLFISNAPGAVQ